MQTFLPYGSVFEAGARVLDVKRLGKQRVEAFQILKANENWYLGIGSGWQDHPATKMWRCHDAALVMYTLEMCEAWVERGYKDSIRKELSLMLPTTFQFVLDCPEAVAMPPWVDDERVMLSHRSNLLRKFPDQYRRFWPDVPDDLDYYWPIQQKVSR